MVRAEALTLPAIPRLAALLPAVLACALATGCASGGMQKTSGLSAGLNCVDDSSDCLGKRKRALNEIISDPTGKWIETPATAQSDASGVRLFAYKHLKKKLDCRQLRVGHAEAVGARTRLRASNDPRLTPGLISRSAILGDEVARELKREGRRRRCKPGVG